MGWTACCPSGRIPIPGLCHFDHLSWKMKIKRYANRCLHLFVVYGVLQSPAAYAQSDAGSILQQQSRQDQRQVDRLPGAPAAGAPDAKTPLSGPRVVIRSLKFTGHEGLVTDAELGALTARWMGQEVDFAGLDRIARQVTELLRSKRWFLAQAYLPQQDVTEGHIEIAVQAGQLDGSDGKGQPFSIGRDDKRAVRLSAEYIEKVAGRYLKPGDKANESSLERALLLLGDVPGVTARSQLEPGLKPGTTSIVLNMEQGPLLGGSVMADNYGSRYTGNAQINASFQINDPKGLGDQYTFNATQTEGLKLIRLGYSLPVSSNGTRLSLSWSPMTYKIVEGLGVAAGLKGSSNTTALTLSYPFKRSRLANVYGSLSVSRKSLRDDSSGGLLKNKRSDSTNATLSVDQLDSWGGGGLLNGNVSLTAGQLDLSRVESDRAADASGYATQGSFEKLSSGLTRLQRITSNLNLMVNVYGQVAGKNLDSSERFALGGPNGVRAYAGGEGSGDSGWVSNIELRYDWRSLASEKAGQVQLVAFYDAGHIRLHKDPGTTPIATLTGRNSYGLAGWGVGVNLNKPASHAVRVVWAHKSGLNPGRSNEGMDSDGRANASRMWLQGSWWY